MSSLVRTAIGPFNLDRSVQLDSLSTEVVEQHLLPATLAVENLPKVTLSAAELEDIANGKSIRRSSPGGATEIAALDEQGLLRALLVPVSSELLQPTRNFVGLTASISLSSANPARSDREC